MCQILKSSNISQKSPCSLRQKTVNNVNFFTH
jgi:hypothetical protein